jgi:hypothetical protein
VLDTLTPRRLVYERDDTAIVEEGSPLHAVPLDGKERGPAICGTRPGKRTAWSIFEGITTTCERCQRVLANQQP